MVVLESLIDVDEFVINEYVLSTLSSEDYSKFSSGDLYHDVLDYIDKIYECRKLPRNDFLNAVISVCLDNDIVSIF